MKRTILSILILVCGLITTTAQIRFNSDFESGAIGEISVLDSVLFVMKQQDTIAMHSYVVKGSYDPANPVDTALAASPRWFYFSMTGVKDKLIFLNFEDTDPVRPMYSYDNVNWTRFESYEASFRRVSKRFEQDTVYVAYYQPYTFSYLQKRLSQWNENEWVEIDSIGHSYEHRPLLLMHITDQSVPAESKKRLWIHARQHPSESPVSWLTDGVISALVADNPTAAALRKAIDAYILPMTNPDGVYNGLSRSNAIGVNQEINFARGEDSTVVEVAFIKKRLEELNGVAPFDVALNMHSQVAPYSSYWIHRAEGTSKDFLRREFVLADLTTSFNDYIRPEDMQFSKIADRYPEGWFWNNAGERTLAITFETSYTCYSGRRDGEWIDSLSLRSFGERLLFAVAESMEISLPGRVIVLPPDKVTQKWERVSSEELTYMGDVAWKAVKPNAKMKYSAPMLEKGEYEVYKYISAPNDEKESKGERGWKKIDTFIQKGDGKLIYKFKAGAMGDCAGALLFVNSNKL